MLKRKWNVHKNIYPTLKQAISDDNAETFILYYIPSLASVLCPNFI